jgi:hypothetical protein
MLVACRLAGLSALKTHYADIDVRTLSGARAVARRSGRSLHPTLAGSPQQARTPSGPPFPHLRPERSSWAA